MNNPLRKYLALLPALFCLALVACSFGNADGSSGHAQIRLLNLSSGYTSLDLYSNNGDSDTDTQQFSAIALGAVSNYASVKSDTYTLKIRKTGTSGNLTSWSAALAEDTHATYVAYGATNQFALLSLDEDTDKPDSGYAKVQVLNTTAASSFDVYLTSASDSLDDVSATVSAVAPGVQSAAATINSGTYRLRVTAAGSKTDVRLNIPDLTLSSQGVVSIILTDSIGSGLVNAVVLPQQGQPTTYDNTNSAQLRMLNVSNGYPSLDLYTNDGDSDTDTQQFAGIARGAITGYAALKADTYALKFRKSGASGVLLSQDATLSEDTHVTWVTYGATSHFGALPIYEDVAAPDTSGYAKLQILNTTASDSLDVYLTGTDDALTDVGATLAAVAPATQSSTLTIASGTYRLRITGAGSKTDLRLDVPQVTLGSQDIVSIVLADTAGGILVNAVVLPQQGTPTVLDNGGARIRGAAGLSAGAAVTVNVAGTDILTSRPAKSFIADSYATLAAGTVPVVVTVDGVAVASGNVALQAGGDYTLLVWDSGGATQMTLIPDDNHAPTSNNVELRLINAMSGLGVPLTLAVNYAPIAEYIDLGAASALTEVGAGTDYRFDVEDAQTLDTLLTRDSITLAGGGVYTFLLAGGGSIPVVGTLRKDR